MFPELPEKVIKAEKTRKYLSKKTHREYGRLKDGKPSQESYHKNVG